MNEFLPVKDWKQAVGLAVFIMLVTNVQKKGQSKAIIGHADGVLENVAGAVTNPLPDKKSQ